MLLEDPSLHSKLWMGSRWSLVHLFSFWVILLSLTFSACSTMFSCDLLCLNLLEILWSFVTEPLWADGAEDEVFWSCFIFLAYVRWFPFEMIMTDPLVNWINNWLWWRKLETTCWIMMIRIRNAVLCFNCWWTLKRIKFIFVGRHEKQYCKGEIVWRVWSSIWI